METEEERDKELENRSIEIIQSELQKKIKNKSLRDLLKIKGLTFTKCHERHTITSQKPKGSQAG